MAISAAPATTRSSCSTSSACWNAAPCAPATSTAAMVGRRCWAPVIERYSKRKLVRFFRADAAFALPDLYKTLEAAGYFYAIRLPANSVLREHIAHRLRRPVGRPPKHVRRFYEDFEYQAKSWDKPRRVVAKIAWHPGELFPRVGFVVTNLPMEPEWVSGFYNRRGTAEQHIREGK